MPEDRSLDDFVGAGASEEADEAAADADDAPDADPEHTEVDDDVGEADDETPADGDEGATETDGEPVEPPSITATWHTDGIACERCDAAVERRWDCDGDYVCADCKDW